MIFEFNSKNWKLSVNDTNHPCLEHKSSGSIWKSVFPWLGMGCHGASQNLLHCEYAGKNINSTCSLNTCNDDSAELNISWEKFGIEIKLHIHEYKGALKFAVSEGGVTEKEPELYRLAWLDLLPGLGACARGDDGYVFIPSSQGAIHYFDEDKRKLPAPDLTGVHSEFAYQSPWGGNCDEFHCRRKIYGSFQNDHAWEAQVPMPYIGIVSKKSALMQVIEEGECFSEYHFAADAGPENLIWIDFRLIYRENFHSAVDFSKRETAYHSLTGADVSWQAMAHKYRSFLIEEKNVSTLEERAQKSEELNYLLKNGQIRSNFGNHKPVLDGSGEMIVKMKYIELAEVVNKLYQAGMTKCQLTCVGFNRDGHDGCYPTIFPFCDDFGTEDEFKQAMAEVKSMGWKFSFHLQYWDSFKKSPDFSIHNVIMQEDGSPLCGGLWAGGLSYILCPTVAEVFMKRDLPKIKECGFEGVVYLDAALTYIETCCNDSHPLSRGEFLKKYVSNLSYASALFGGVQNEFGLAGTLGYVDYILCSPRDERHSLTQLRESKLYGCGYIHNFVPAWDMIAHGLTAYNVYPLDYSDAESWNSFILDSARRGALPEMRFDNGIPSDSEIQRLKKTYEMIKSIFSKLQFETFQDYSELQPGVYESVFGNKKIISNYLKHAVEVDGEMISARSFECFKL